MFKINREQIDARAAIVAKSDAYHDSLEYLETAKHAIESALVELSKSPVDDVLRISFQVILGSDDSVPHYAPGILADTLNEANYHATVCDLFGAHHVDVRKMLPPRETREVGITELYFTRHKAPAWSRTWREEIKPSK